MKAFVRRYPAMSLYMRVHDFEVNDIFIPEKNIILLICEDGSGVMAYRSTFSPDNVTIVKEIDVPEQVIDDAEAYMSARDALQIHQQFIQGQIQGPEALI